VLEHLEDPHRELQAVRKVLGPGGVLFIEVPNGSGNRRLPIDDNRAHLHFFSLASLANLLAGHGFEIIATQTDAVLDPRYADSLRVVAKAFSLPKWSPTLLSDRLDSSARDKVIVWGAGSLALELLANFFDEDLIDFFVDSKVELQGSEILSKKVLHPSAIGDGSKIILINSIDFADSIESDLLRLYPKAQHRVIRISDLLS
jgi:hypothetical protein